MFDRSAIKVVCDKFHFSGELPTLLQSTQRYFADEGRRVFTEVQERWYDRVYAIPAPLDNPFSTKNLAIFAGGLLVGALPIYIANGFGKIRVGSLVSTLTFIIALSAQPRTGAETPQRIAYSGILIGALLTHLILGFRDQKFERRLE